MTALLGVTVFAGIDRAELDRIEAGSRLVEPHDGTQIFAEGDEADSVYAIIGGAGRIRIGALDRNSKGLMIEVFGVGDIFGEIGVIEATTRTADAVAEGRLRLLRIAGRHPLRRELRFCVRLRSRYLGAVQLLIYRHLLMRTLGITQRPQH